jgi:hypothetical protein
MRQPQLQRGSFLQRAPLALLFLLAAACHDAPYSQGEHILYYPRSNVYLDQDNKVYLLFDTVEQSWQRRAELAPKEQEALGPSVPIEDAPRPVYRANEQHRLVYGTSIYSNDAELAKKRREDSVAAAPPPVVNHAPEEPEAPKKKSKVGRWLQKIFGGKKKEHSD